MPRHEPENRSEPLRPWPATNSVWFENWPRNDTSDSGQATGLRDERSARQIADAKMAELRRQVDRELALTESEREARLAATHRSLMAEREAAAALASMSWLSRPALSASSTGIPGASWKPCRPAPIRSAADRIKTDIVDKISDRSTRSRLDGEIDAGDPIGNPILAFVILPATA